MEELAVMSARTLRRSWPTSTKIAIRRWVLCAGLLEIRQSSRVRMRSTRSRSWRNWNTRLTEMPCASRWV